jgi:hypothetical protein
LSFAQQEEPSQSEEQEEIIEEDYTEITGRDEPLQPQPPPLKERRPQKPVRFDKNARHSCAANNFTVNISGQSLAIAELKLEGGRSDIENLEIGSLPLGIDITFLNNSDYEYRPQISDNAAVLQIINQPGSQKGDFNIPIIFKSGNLTTICQINTINK